MYIIIYRSYYYFRIEDPVKSIGQPLQINSNIIPDVKIECRKQDSCEHTNQIHVCKKCGVSYAKLSELRKHRKSHTIPQTLEQQRTCNYCGKVFCYRYNMLRHRKTHNNSSKSCPYCAETNKNPALLVQHMEREHSDMKNFACPTCGKTFFKKKNLKQHMIVHSGVKKYTCEICGLSFALSGNLKVHKRLHTGERPYTCNHCGRGFVQHSALRSHEATHSDQK